VYEASIPRDDLHVNRGSFEFEPSFDQDTELDFLPKAGGGATMTGELAATEREEARLVPALLKRGITVSAVHNHLTQLTPEVEWVHVMANGDPVAIARKVRAALQATTATPFPVKEGRKRTSLPMKRLAATLGGEAVVDDGGVVTVSVDRGDQISMSGQPIPSDLGVGGLVYFQPMRGGRAATTGEICLLGSEVQPVLAALAKAGLTITALHNHMLDTSPSTYFVHWFGIGTPAALAHKVRTALDKANYPKKG
jgi:hypothetical protein